MNTAEPIIIEKDLHSDSSTAERVGAGLGVAVFTVGTGFVAYFDPSAHQFFPVCPLFALTGFACPGCGLTRGFHALFHGDVLTALDFNLLTPVWAVIFFYVAVSMVLLAARGTGLPMWPKWPRFMFAFLAVLIVFGVLRNLPMYPFSVLFP